MTKVIIVISGGALKDVYSTEPIELILVDHDNIDAGDDVPTINDIFEQTHILSEEEIDKYLTDIRIDNILKLGNEDEESI